MKSCIVFIRLDKIGDLIATLPSDQLTSLNNQGKKIKWVISKGLGTIIQHSLPHREFIEIENTKKFNRLSFNLLLEFLKKEQPEAVIVFYAPWWVSLACFLAQVPLRVGRKSQWHSFLFFNKGIRQERTLAEKHEADYNRELVEKGLDLAASFSTPLLEMKAENNPQILEKFQLELERFIVVHPGMFGSALNWPQSKYNELIAELVKTTTVAITGTASDEKFLTDIKLQWEHHPKVRILQNKLKMEELLSLLKMSSCVIAPSTGVLHLAAALGKNCVGIYSPIQVHHPRRWGPRGPHASFVLPEMNSPDCMEKISVESVLEKAGLI